MKYQNTSTRLQFTKINALLSRLKPSRFLTQQYHTEPSSRQAIEGQSTLQQRRRKQEKLNQKLNLLQVDVVHHQNHNILVFIPGPSGYVRKQNAIQRKHPYRDAGSSKTKMQRAWDLKQVNSPNSSFRVKKFNGTKQDSRFKQNKATVKILMPQSLKSSVQQSKAVKESAVLEQKATSRVRKQQEGKGPEEAEYLKQLKPPIQKQLKAPIQKYLVNHKLPQKLTQQELLLQETKISCQDPRINFVLDILFALDPHLIKRLFSQTANQKIRLILNYEGCFRALAINYLNSISPKQILSQSNSLMSQVLGQALSSLLGSEDSNCISVKSLYQMLTGLALESIEVKDCCCPQKLLSMMSALDKSQNVIIAETANSRLSLIHHHQGSLSIKNHIVQSVYSELKSKPQQIVSYFQQHCKAIYLVDLYPLYYFIYKKMEYSLGNDSILCLEVREQVTIYLQISKQTTALGAKVKLRLEQKREQQVQQVYSSFIESSQGVKKQLKLGPGAYWVRVSDNNECPKHKQSIVVGIVCKRDISEWIKELD